MKRLAGTESQRLLLTTWRAMKRRCYDPKHHNYRFYGGRGITVCDRWLKSFQAFAEDVGPKPTPTHSLDRYPLKEGPYEPGNVRWATQIEQCNNTKSNRILTFDGRSQSASTWAAELGMRPGALNQRLRYGWPLDRALNEPPRDWGPGKTSRMVKARRKYPLAPDAREA